MGSSGSVPVGAPVYGLVSIEPPYVRWTSSYVVVPLESDVGAGGDCELGLSRSAAVAVHESRSDILDGVVAVGGCADSIKADLLAINDERLEGGVAVSQLGSSQSESVRVLHFDDDWLFVEKKAGKSKNGSMNSVRMDSRRK